MNLDQQFSIHTMIKSIKLESVSITYYKFQNVEKESLLSQNWTASEEEDVRIHFINYEQCMFVKLACKIRLKKLASE